MPSPWIWFGRYLVTRKDYVTMKDTRPSLGNTGVLIIMFYKVFCVVILKYLLNTFIFSEYQFFFYF